MEVCGVRIMLWLLYLWRGEKDSGTHLPGGWVGIRADMDVVVKITARVRNRILLRESIHQLNYCSSVYCANSWQKHVFWLTWVHWFCIKFVWLITLPALIGVPNKFHSETVTTTLNQLYLLTRYDAVLQIQHMAQWKCVVPLCNSKSSARLKGKL